jgi:dTDP-glucose pyrophosphorylase
VSELTLVVLAAGIGRRYGGLKQIEPIGPSGEIIVDYSVYDALRTGFERVVFVIRPEIEKAFRERVGRSVEQRCETHYVFQILEDVPAGFRVPPARQKPWGTAHATLACKDAVDGPFAVVNADDFYGRAAYQALANHLQGPVDGNGLDAYCVVGYRLEDTLTDHGHVARGVCAVDRNDNLIEIHERTRIEKHGPGARYTEDQEQWFELPPGTTVSMNSWGFMPSLFGELELRFRRFLGQDPETLATAELYLPNVVNELIREGRATVKVLATKARWFGVTYRQDLPRVQAGIRDLISQGVYPENLWEEGA